ncbi:MerR family transcriptional regulator [Mycobacterium sp. AMU20-3851]|uniref:MerR family transcriptional regulator n=1 Tax=Mycobacterium sp. AMU20-3851 TaxID=3122055 RepID=UPI003754F398
MATLLTIGEVARRTGVAQTTLRYYEQIGLLPPPQRVGGQRRYPESAMIRLEVIRACKAAGFALEEIVALMGDHAPGKPVARALAEAKLIEIDAQMRTLERAKEIIRWGMACECPSIEECGCGIPHTLLAG